MRTRLREMLPADVPKVLERLKIQNERDDTSYAMPQVFDEFGVRLANIPLALVAEDVETGEVMQGHIFERTVEQTSFGIDPEATVCSMHEQDAVWFLLRERGYKDLHLLVPKDAVPLMEHGLTRIMGMINTGEVLTHFYRSLDPAVNLELRKWYDNQKEPA